MNYRKEITVLFIFSLFIVCQTMLAQSTGKIYILENGDATIFGEHDFASSNSGLIDPGMVFTSREGNKGHVNFGAGSNWVGASETRYVDGYVRVFHDNAFVFPIGNNGLYRPIAISGAKQTVAAYYDFSPYLQLLEDDLTPNALETENITQISNQEFWDIKGSTATHLSISWGKESDIEEITDNELSTLTLLGWKNGQWEVIPSQVQMETPSIFLQNSTVFSSASSFDRGVIVSNDVIIPDEYRYITLGATGENNLNEPSSQERQLNEVSLYPNPAAEDLYIDLEGIDGGIKSITIYNIYGLKMEERTFTGNVDDIQQFSVERFENGIYKVNISQDNNTSVTRKFVISRLY